MAVSSRVKQVVLGLGVIFVAVQFIRPDRTNPETDPSRTIRAALGEESALPAVLDRACGDCHSNDTVWPGYTQVAPLSWLMASAVGEGRKAVNFSEWAGYPPAVQRALLSASCDDVSRGTMPGVYAWLRPEVKLSAQDIELICAMARQP